MHDDGARRQAIFDSERLWQELSHPDHERRHAAIAVMEALAELADLRAEKYGLSFAEARLHIFDRGLLDRDLRDADPAIVRAARRVREEVGWVAAVHEGERGALAGC